MCLNVISFDLKKCNIFVSKFKVESSYKLQDTKTTTSTKMKDLCYYPFRKGKRSWTWTFKLGLLRPLQHLTSGTTDRPTPKKSQLQFKF